MVFHLASYTQMLALIIALSYGVQNYASVANWSLYIMRMSRYFLPILRENPAEATVVSHRLMLRAGMIRQLGAGMYNWLPLGLKVLRKIERIIEDEMNKAGAIQILMPTIQPAELWQESGRYEDYGKEMLRITDRHNRPMLYGPTNEEVVTDIFRQNVRSYKDLPLNLYHIQWKFRDEIRPRFGVMRGREFLMKDAYSFDIDPDSSKKAYTTMYEAYLRCFKRMGLGVIPVRANTGPIGGDLSHEFHVLADTGESEIFYDEAFDSLTKREDVDFDALSGLYAAADELHIPEECSVPKEKLKSRRGIEVGHVFNFGTKYSQAMRAFVTNAEGKSVPVHMGSYGIGVTRLVGAIIEASHDEKGIIWPDAVAPFSVGLLNLKPGMQACDSLCDGLYETLTQAGLDVLYDDRQESAGSKFATTELIGLPWQVAIGPRGAEQGMAEIKNRKTGHKQEEPMDQVLSFVQKTK
jgi:prolyl-tRNA synthetase